MSDINKPATLDEIARAMSKDKSTVSRWQKKEGWKFTEQPAAGKSLLIFTLKDLPEEIRLTVQRKRLDDDIAHFHNQQQEQQHVEFNTTSIGIVRGNAAGIRPHSGKNQPVAVALDAASAGTRDTEKSVAGQGLGGSAGNTCGNEVASVTEGMAVDETEGMAVGETGRSQPGMEPDGKGLADAQLLDGGIALRGPGRELCEYTAEQRDTGLAIETVMRWIDRHPGNKATALRELNQGYKDNTLSSPLKSALGRCKQKSSGKAKTDDILTTNTVDKWVRRYKEQGNYLPNVRQKDYSLQLWHIDLKQMLDKNRQKRCYSLLHEELVKTYPELSYDAMCRWIREKYSRMDVIKGRHTGMQLRAKQSYQPRSAEGMLPWDEVHADGWNTHFTAPHPRTGEFVTYELWDFHDVATRYIPPFGLGLTENFEVIAKGIENCIRDQGVMCILQTDSTKIIKNNAKFTGDPIKSISDKAGFTIVHPKTVGNAQANGIAENWHAWADKQCRVLATYQAKGQDSLTLRNVKKITAQMVKAADKGELELSAKLKAQAERIGGGIVFGSYYEALNWIEVNLRQKWNNKPHSSLKKLRDPITDKLRHQTPQECLDEHKVNGWEPVLMDESILDDLFRVHVELKVKRCMVEPYGGMLFKAPELAAYEGDKVIVAYDSMDYTQVWVKSLKGELICVAPFHAPTGYRSVTAKEAAEERRAVAQIKNKEKQIITIKKRAGIDGEGSVIEGEVILQRLEVVPTETVVPLKRVEVEINEQEAERAPMTYMETIQFIKGVEVYDNTASQ